MRAYLWILAVVVWTGLVGCSGDGGPVAAADVAEVGTGPGADVELDVPDPGGKDVQDAGGVADDLPDVAEVEAGPDAVEDVRPPPLDTRDVADSADDAVEDAAEDAPDPSDSDPEVPPDVVEVVEPCLPPEPQPTPVGDAQVEIGLLVAQTFGGLADNDTIEIVQGPQGGVHLEVAVRVTPPDSYSDSKVFASVEALTFQPCCAEDGAPEVGTYVNPKVVMFGGAQPQTYVSSVLPVVFEEDLASIYEDRDCCVRAVVQVYAPGTQDVIHSGWQRLTLRCVDVF